MRVVVIPLSPIWFLYGNIYKLLTYIAIEDYPFLRFFLKIVNIE